MPDQGIDLLRSLSRLNTKQLRGTYTQIFGMPPQCQWGKRWLLRFLSYKIQEQSFRPLSRSAQSRLRQLSIELKNNSKSNLNSEPRLKAGTRLVREWRGQIHTVTVRDTQYEYKGSNYASLSEIARLITGTRWSGPAFFGLQRKPDPKSPNGPGS